MKAVGIATFWKYFVLPCRGTHLNIHDLMKFKKLLTNIGHRVYFDYNIAILF